LLSFSCCFFMFLLICILFHLFPGLMCNFNYAELSRIHNLCHMWWLILCCNLVRVRDMEAADDTLHLSVCEVASRNYKHLNQQTIKTILINVGEHHPVYWGLSNTKRQREVELFSLSSLSSVFSSGLSSFLVLRLSDVDWTCTNSCAPLVGYQVFGLDKLSDTGYPGDPVCRWKVMGLLNFYNLMLQSLMIHFFVLVSTYTHNCVCYSGEL
jgi:hypothetical protein